MNFSLKFLFIHIFWLTFFKIQAGCIFECSLKTPNGSWYKDLFYLCVQLMFAQHWGVGGLAAPFDCIIYLFFTLTAMSTLLWGNPLPASTSTSLHLAAHASTKTTTAGIIILTKLHRCWNYRCCCWAFNNLSSQFYSRLIDSIGPLALYLLN